MLNHKKTENIVSEFHKFYISSYRASTMKLTNCLLKVIQGQALEFVQDWLQV